MNLVMCGDVLDKLKDIPDESVNCCVTSPPYWGLRDYGTAQWEDGDSECDHRHPAEQRQLPHGDGRVNDFYADNRVLKKGVGALYWIECAKCGARRIDQQIGLEPTPEAYVARLVEIFREVRRVLRDDGTLWLNLGDSYATGTGSARVAGGDCFGKANSIVDSGDFPACQPNRMPIPGLKPKDLVGIPWRVAFALQADGWYLRSDIIWHKSNPMPESVRDRPTKAHEYLFLLAKSKRYYYDAEKIAEESTCARMRGPALHPDLASTNGNSGLCRRPFSATRNRRSVWAVTTEPFLEAHFATFPTKLIMPCILAGCPPDGWILDPFAGSGTTGLVAAQEGRNSILIELNAAYVDMIERRCNGTTCRI